MDSFSYTKSLVILRIKLLFDPPQSSEVIKTIKE